MNKKFIFLSGFLFFLPLAVSPFNTDEIARITTALNHNTGTVYQTEVVEKIIAQLRKKKEDTSAVTAMYQLIHANQDGFEALMEIINTSWNKDWKRCCNELAQFRTEKAIISVDQKITQLREQAEILMNLHPKNKKIRELIGIIAQLETSQEEALPSGRIRRAAQYIGSLPGRAREGLQRVKRFFNRS